MFRRARFPIIRIVLALAVVTAMAGIIQDPLVSVYRIAGNSMRPSFQDGDRVLVTGYTALTGGIESGDAVIAELGDETLIKRVIGCPGDTLEFSHGQVLRNGESEDFDLPREFFDDYSHGKLVLGDDEYFLAGDNRRVSIDSRSFGPLHRAAIVGEVVFRISQDKGARAHEESSSALEGEPENH